MFYGLGCCFRLMAWGRLAVQTLHLESSLVLNFRIQAVALNHLSSSVSEVEIQRPRLFNVYPLLKLSRL